MTTEITVTIDQEGNPTIRVNGVKGKSCTDLTKALEAELGSVTTDQKTGEFHETASNAIRDRQAG